MNVEKRHNVGPSGLDIAFERLGDPAAPPVFLLMGGGAQMIAWPDGFCAELVRCGLHLIRFDNRDAGLSTHMTGAPEPDFAAAMAGDYSTVTYSLSDMAADTIGLADALGFGPVHIVGASMGGMIAQTVAIEYPSRVKSLTSIMSTTGDRSVGQTDFSVLAGLGEPPWADREAYIRWRVRSMQALGSPGFPFDEEAAAQNAALCWDRDHDPLAFTRQAVAVLKSGDRTPMLRKLKAPTLVIHGKADKMIDVSGGVATANAIEGAELLLFEGMGHSLPEPLWAEMAGRIAHHIRKADRVWGR
ncbi:MAG TPA: alpha/beta hydrolase [Chitinophagaceae bacterium]|jgi:pimeloyl-ACP methyl ester carboxylesterase|nr:alpha/beta hydrolase [Chitinophagaceae bacterium]